MPLNTASALAVSLIPAAVILVYNIMENGAPGGVSVQNLKNFVSSDNSLSESSSSLALKNISIYINGSGIRAITTNDIIGEISPSTTTAVTEQVPTTFVTSAATTTTEATTTQRTTTTTTPVPVKLVKLPICCSSLSVNGENHVTGNCEGKAEPLKGSDVWNVPSRLMGTRISTKFQ